MFKFTTKSRALLLTFIVSLMTGFPVLADDTEVYLGDLAFSTNIRPNVLFIIDTSGSMGTNMTVTTGTYDPTQTYTGSCDPTRIYWTTSGTPPTCSTDNYFDVSSNVCDDSQAALGAGGTGMYIGRLARYRISSRREDRWRSLSDRDHTSIVECQVDYGVHGNGVSSDAYPADENDGGPYNATAATPAFNWNVTGDSYTLYSANYLNWHNSPGTSVTMTRLQIVQDVLVNLVNSVSGVNAALMRFDDSTTTTDNQGGYFVLPMQQLNSSSRPTFVSTINGLTDDGYTPLAETLYEAARYFRGENVLFGNSTTPGTNDPGVLDPSNNAKYDSPIEYQCQQNFVVLLTDGDPTYDYDADTAIQALSGLTALAGTCDFNTGDDCLDELAHYLHDVDQIPNSTMDDNQTISTYTIGFTTNQQLLQDTATKGGGKYKTADSAQELTTAFTQIISDILAVNTTFVAPAVPVNAFNRLTHRDELYFALFRPERFPQWNGNIKRYQLAGNPPIITDANGAPAVDPATGFFGTGTTSIWTSGSDAPDGDDVRKGGAAAELSLSRNMYTYTDTVSAPSNTDLTQAAHAFHESNNAVTAALLGNAGMSSTYRTELLQWARGVDLFDDDQDGSTTDARRWMGDPLHGNPVVVNYGGTNANPDITLYIGTNEGVLHAIDTSDGSELFSFIPQELLPNLDILFNNNGANSHPYGLDGPLTVWANDVNNNGVLQDAAGNTEAGEHAYLYVGMRRGGNNYYALDVTNRSVPRLKWMIQGGTGNFARLAQTWSKVELATIKNSGNKRKVLLFGGGYDVNQDTETAGVDTEGNAIYMVDASTGARLWWASDTGTGASLTKADMDYSIPASVMTGDIDADGYTDIMFAVDMGGQLWRFDFNNSGTDTAITGGVVATIDGNGTSDRRRFYVKPDVSLMKINGVVHYAVAIGSGYRAHPLSTVTQDRFYMFFIPNVYTIPANYNSPITESDLLDVTNDLTPTLGTNKGWRLTLDTGEKVLASSLTVDGMVFFTTYKPDTNLVNSCAPSQGVGRLYAINAYDARPVKNLDGVGSINSLTVTDRYKTLVRGGIQPEPRLIFTDDDHPVLVVGPEKIEDLDLFNPIKRTSWTD